MSDIVSLDGATDSVFSAAPLMGCIDALTGTGLSTQLNALVVERQQRIDLFGSDPALAAVADGQQALVKKSATLHLAKLMPQLIEVTVLDPSQAATVFGILAQRLTTMPPTGAGEILTAVTGKLREYRDDARGLADDLEREAVRLAANYATLRILIDKEVAALDGPGGAIAGTLAKIDATREAMAAALNQIVASGNALGEGVKNLATSIIGIFQSSAAATKPPAGGTTPGTAEAASGEPLPEYPLEGIALVSQGVEDLNGAQAAYRAHSAELIRLYQQLYGYKSSLAIVTSVGVQVGLFETSLRNAAAAALAVGEKWAAVEGGYSGLARELADAADPQAQAAIIADRLKSAAGQSWKRLAAHAQGAKELYTGVA